MLKKPKQNYAKKDVFYWKIHKTCNLQYFQKKIVDTFSINNILKEE